MPMSSTRPSQTNVARTKTKGRPTSTTRRARLGHPRPTTPAEQLASQLKASENALHEAVTSFAQRVAGQLARAASAATAEAPPKRAVIAAMLERVREVKLKPERGRL